MAGRSLEERVAALEAAIADLRDRIIDQGAKKAGWQAMVGAFLNDPYFEQAMKYGRQYRESLRPKKKKSGKSKKRGRSHGDS
jgi:hypothetical protein